MSGQTKGIILGIVGVLMLGSAFATGSFESLKTFGIFVAAWLTFFIYSFLYKDNPFYKFAEHLFVGVGAAYGVVVTFWQMIVPNLIHKLFMPAVKNLPKVTEVV